MLRSKGIALVAACAALAVGQMVRAADGVAPRSPLLMDDAATTAPTTAAATAPATTATITPLMGILERVGLGKPLEDAGISVTGYVEGGYTNDTSNPPGGILTDRAFDTRSNSIQFDQVELNVSRSVDYTKSLDVGFELENIYGDDTPYFHSNGLTIAGPTHTASPFAGTGSTATIHPKAQYDLTQANFTISSNALFKGIAFEGGKFDTLLGAELIDPYTTASTNAFYSHSFIFTQEPFTHTGALGIVNLNDAITFQGGITRGWDQATNDVNGDIDFIGQLKYVLNPQTTVYLNGITGDEEPSAVPGTPGHDGYRTVFDIVGSYAASDQLSLSANGMYAFEPQTGNLGSGGGTGQWYAVAAYASYKVADQLTINFRGEWFDDQDGAAPTQLGVLRESNQYYEATLGATIHPFPNDAVFNNFFIRPEVRYDYANHTAFDNVGGLPTNRYFLTGAVDGVFAF